MDVFIAMDGYTLPCGFILKELCLLFPNGEFTHLLLKPPANQHLSEIDVRTIRYTTNNLNNLCYHDGDVPYECMQDVLKKVQICRIFTYSEVSQRLLQEILPTSMITNIQSLGFTMPSSLPDPSCFRTHNPRYCAKAKAIAVKRFVESGF